MQLKSVYRYLTLFASLFLLNSACKKKDKSTTTPPVVVPSTYGKVSVKVTNEVDGQPITFGTLTYTNASGNNYSITLLKYYITNFTLIKEDSSLTNFGNYSLIDASDSSTCGFTLDSVANGKYKAVRFYLGVDTGHNHSGLQEGALDPINGMIWTWKTGYIFFKHEGNFIDSSKNKILVYHYGTDPALATIDIPVSMFEVAGNTRTINLKFNLNSLYASPVPVNFSFNNNVRQSTGIDDISWISTLRRNFASAFTVNSVQ